MEHPGYSKESQLKIDFVSPKGNWNQTNTNLHNIIYILPPMKINMSPKKGPFQKENRLPTIIFSGDMLVFWGE